MILFKRRYTSSNFFPKLSAISPLTMGLTGHTRTMRKRPGFRTVIGTVDITDNSRPEFRKALRKVGEELYRLRAGGGKVR